MRIKDYIWGKSALYVNCSIPAAPRIVNRSRRDGVPSLANTGLESGTAIRST